MFPLESSSCFSFPGTKVQEPSLGQKVSRQLCLTLTQENVPADVSTASCLGTFYPIIHTKHNTMCSESHTPRGTAFEDTTTASELNLDPSTSGGNTTGGTLLPKMLPGTWEMFLRWKQILSSFKVDISYNFMAPLLWLPDKVANLSTYSMSTVHLFKTFVLVSYWPEWLMGHTSKKWRSPLTGMLFFNNAEVHLAAGRYWVQLQCWETPLEQSGIICSVYEHPSSSWWGRRIVLNHFSYPDILTAEITTLL